MGVEGAEVDGMVVTLMALTSLGEDVRKRMDFQVRSRSPNLEARRAIRMMWPAPSDSGPAASRTIMITMRICITMRNTQDLTTLLQMLKEHYCGSLTFWEQRNTIENLHQKPQEAAIDFLIRVGTSVSNLGKDRKDELTD